MHFIVFLLTSTGLYLVLSSQWPSPYRGGTAALRARAPKQLTQTEIAVNSIAEKLMPHIDMDPIKQVRLNETLRNLDYHMTPESFQAHALARGLLLGTATVWLVLLNPVLGLVTMGTVVFAVYSQEQKKLDKQIAERRRLIERELPQFASTIRQSLVTTRDIVAILATYRKVCGPTLKSEIDRTINDIVTGNPERAIKALESRVASPKLGQLTRGLIAVIRGDDQALYFDMLAAEFRKEQNEEVSKELQERPQQLAPYMGMLFGCLVLMIIASLGTYLMQEMGTLFS